MEAGLEGVGGEIEGVGGAIEGVRRLGEEGTSTFMLAIPRHSLETPPANRDARANVTVRRQPSPLPLKPPNRASIS
eukprot:3252512-Rhodomonas_salina.2